MGFAILLTTVTTVFDYAFVRRWNLVIGIPDYIFLLFTNLLEDFVGIRFALFANGVINARITPHSVEASIYAIITGLSNLGFGVVGTLFGTYVSDALGINQQHMDNLHQGILVKLAFSVLPFLLLPLIPNKEEINTDEDLKRVNLEERKEHLIPNSN